MKDKILVAKVNTNRGYLIVGKSTADIAYELVRFSFLLGRPLKLEGLVRVSIQEFENRRSKNSRLIFDLERSFKDN